jgi:hypothetical protein
MGLFKSFHELNKVAKELRDEHDPGEQMKHSVEKMNALQAMLAAQTQAANIAATGTPATASIVTAQSTGELVNFQPTMKIDLTVFPAGGVPYPVSVTQVVEQVFLAKAAPGNQVQVKVDQADPQVVWIDWAAS